jgi:hypothetical protein
MLPHRHGTATVLVATIGATTGVGRVPWRQEGSAGAPHKKERGGDQNSSKTEAPACSTSNLSYLSSRQWTGFSLCEFL